MPDKGKRPGDRHPLFSAVTPRKIPDAVYKQIVGLITRGVLKPGQRLPSERAMAQEMGVSRQSIREAISRARTSGLVQVRQGEGAFVISSFQENLRSPLSILLEAQPEKIFEFLEIRKLIEGWCAARASEVATSEDLKKLQRSLNKMDKAVPPEARWEKADYEFHATIAAASHNVIAMHVMEGLKDSFETYFRVKKFTTRPKRKDALHQQHQDIFEAIRRRDPQTAKRKIAEHLDYVEAMIAEDLDKHR